MSEQLVGQLFAWAIEARHNRLLAEWETMAASIAPAWRVVNFQTVWSAYLGQFGTFTAATMSGMGAAAAGAIPVAAAVGTWVALGSGYYEARQIVKQKAALSGFADGFVAGILEWKGPQVANILGVRSVMRKNSFDSEADVFEAKGYNEGLTKGFALGSVAPADAKKVYRIHLRRLAGIRASGAWSRNADEARSQQRNYVKFLAIAGLKHGIIKAE
jgi:hypothetical protein